MKNKLNSTMKSANVDMKSVQAGSLYRRVRNSLSAAVSGATSQQSPRYDIDSENNFASTGHDWFRPVIEALKKQEERRPETPRDVLGTYLDHVTHVKTGIPLAKQIDRKTANVPLLKLDVNAERFVVFNDISSVNSKYRRTLSPTFSTTSRDAPASHRCLQEEGAHDQKDIPNFFLGT
jgi:hypothetical protein